MEAVYDFPYQFFCKVSIFCIAIDNAIAAIHWHYVYTKNLRDGDVTKNCRAEITLCKGTSLEKIEITIAYRYVLYLRVGEKVYRHKVLRWRIGRVSLYCLHNSI